MTIDATLDALLSEATPPLRDALRRAYDLGYREALAAGTALHASARAAPRSPRASGDDDDFEPDGATTYPLVESASPPPTCPVCPVGRPAEAWSDPTVTEEQTRAVHWSDHDDGASDPSNAAAPAGHSREPLLRILPHATIGTLRDRILYHFDLARFDIDVVICRKGDHARRQLKSGVRLSKYEVEG